MRVVFSVLLAVSVAFAYQVTYPGGSQGWNTTGPNHLTWERVDTDPLNFTVVLTNQNIAYNQVLDSLIDGTVGTVICSTPSGGWPSGSNFQVNLAQDAQHLDSLLAQSSQFDITAVSSNGSTSSPASTHTPTSTATGTGTTSSDTSTTPTGVSSAPPSASAQTNLLAAVVALTALLTAIF